MTTTTTLSTKSSEIARNLHGQSSTNLQLKVGEDGSLFLEMPAGVQPSVNHQKKLPTPPRDTGTEMTTAVEHLHTIANQSLTWKDSPPTFEHLIVHNSAEYKILRNARARLAENSEMFLEKMDEQLIRSIPKTKKSSFFGKRKQTA